MFIRLMPEYDFLMNKKDNELFIVSTREYLLACLNKTLHFLISTDRDAQILIDARLVEIAYDNATFS